ncbi:MAG: YtxH domain-containing protein [Candidatus Dormibacteraeota bacterium]|nr:YtxH domain-containing protein [Candidatus Dormibacteraeota bacterium]
MTRSPSPQERIGAFLVAVDEELIRPMRRYVRGFRRGLLLGVAIGILFTPLAGAELRARLRRGPLGLCGRRRRLGG